MVKQGEKNLSDDQMLLNEYLIWIFKVSRSTNLINSDNRTKPHSNIIIFYSLEICLKNLAKILGTHEKYFSNNIKKYCMKIESKQYQKW